MDIVIKLIAIQNVKGIGDNSEGLELRLNVYPNKPTILVAPNGYGKSSVAAAFRSLNQNRLKLKKSDCFNEDDRRDPCLKIDFVDGNQEVSCNADSSSNSISKHFDVSVISNAIRAKARQTFHSGGKSASASLQVDPIVLLSSVPTQVYLPHQINENLYHPNPPDFILTPEDADLLKCPKLYAAMYGKELLPLLKLLTKGQKGKFLELVWKDLLSKSKNINSEEFLAVFQSEHLPGLLEIEQFATVSSVISTVDTMRFSNNSCLPSLIALQILKYFQVDNANFEAFCKWKLYEYQKDSFKKLFEELNTSSQQFELKEVDGKLELHFPSLHLISNGQRDVMCFMANLEHERHKLRKKDCILIIDEVFDYLDDANLVAVQYYLSRFIKKFRNEGRQIYPLLFTHLSPDHFLNYVFGKRLKIQFRYFASNLPKLNPDFKKILKEREDLNSPLRDNISKYLLHFHPNPIDQTKEFEKFNLNKTWGDVGNFTKYIEGELRKYEDGSGNYDPHAVICFVRLSVEKSVYEALQTDDQKENFLEKKTTAKKLEYAENEGVEIDEKFNYLGLIYNDALHWKDSFSDQQNLAKFVPKLQNLTIKSIILSVFSGIESVAAKSQIKKNDTTSAKLDPHTQPSLF